MIARSVFKLVLLTKKIRNRHFLILDILILLISPFLAVFIRTDGDISTLVTFSHLLFITLFLGVVKLVIFNILGFYNRLWQQASIDELARVVAAFVAVVFVEIFAFYLLKYSTPTIVNGFPYSLPLLDSIISVLFVASTRFSIRLIIATDHRVKRDKLSNIHTLIVGAGDAGVQTYKKLLNNKQFGRISAFVDDDTEKLGLKIKGLPILGPIDDLPKIINDLHIDKVIIALPTVSGSKIRKVHDICTSEEVEVLTLPPIDKILDKDIKINLLRKVQVEDLLRRDLVHSDFSSVSNLIQNKVVLVTGAGGSIGSEICRQICRCSPNSLVLVGHGENSIFEISTELNTNCTSVIKISKIVDVKDKRGLERIFSKYKPDIVFHTAAHKHVPLMEENPTEAVTNNILGTRNLVDVSIQFNIEKFILISSDKAVNPTNVMGASKRVAEMIVLDAAKKYGCNFSAVRFGNVLGSRGSVVKTFYRQLKNGGPITLTHPDIKRFFMTIPEAVQLVLQSAVINGGGEIFVLDMGEPVKIIDLAKDMIKLSGLKLGEDIDFEITGLRPGEKLFEELFLKDEEYKRTTHNKIFQAMNAAQFTNPQLETLLEKIITDAQEEGRFVRDLLQEIVPEYTPGQSKLKIIKSA